MKLSFIEKIMIVATLIIVAIMIVGKIPKTAPAVRNVIEDKKAIDLGITFEEFENAYNEKVMLNESPIISLENAVVEDNGNSVVCKFEDVGIMMVVFKEKDTGKINRIAVLAEPFYNHTNTEKTFLLMAQSTVWSLAAQVFSTNMEQQKYRESAIKRLYTNMNKDYMMNGNIRYKAVQNGKVVGLFIEVKDLPN